MVTNPALRPLERRILRLVGEGTSTSEIARRFRRSRSHIERVLTYTGLERPGPGRASSTTGLRPVERRVLKWRALGADYPEIARRFRRGPGHIERIERLAQYRQYRMQRG